MPRSSLLLAVLVPLVLASCRKADVIAYRVPRDSADVRPAVSAPAAKSAPPAPDSTGGMAGPAVATANGAALTWTVPDMWRLTPGSAMRKATFAIGPADAPTAELAVTAFPGDVGGEVANVNRWRGQINLPPLSEAEIAASVTRLEANGLKITVVDLAGAGSSVRMLGAIVPFGDATWFFKLLGPDPLVASEKATFLAFLSTIRPPAAPTAP